MSRPMSFMDFIDAVICKYPQSGNWYPGMSDIIVSLADIQHLNHFLDLSSIHPNIQGTFIKGIERFFKPLQQCSATFYW